MNTLCHFLFSQMFINVHIFPLPVMENGGRHHIPMSENDVIVTQDLSFLLTHEAEGKKNMPRFIFAR